MAVGVLAASSLVSFPLLFSIGLVFPGYIGVCSFGGLLTFASCKRIQEEDEICSAVVGTNTEDVFALAADKLPVQMTLLH